MGRARRIPLAGSVTREKSEPVDPLQKSQFGVLVPYVALAPTIISGAITLGVMQQIVRAFGRVESSFQFLVHSWSTIVELLSVYKRLRAFEATIYDEPNPDRWTVTDSAD